MNTSDLRYRLAILLVLIAILASLGMSSPTRALEIAESIPHLGDLAPPPPPEPVPPPSLAPVLPPKAARSAKQDGNATWYGKALHGRTTASGERFDMYRFTAAHRTLPFGTVLRITNRENGKWVIVRVTDRGPLAPGRIVDLSYAAARQLGMVQPGVVPVHIETVRSGSSNTLARSSGQNDGQVVREAKVRLPKN